MTSSEIGQKIKDSPIGAGIITEITLAGFPQVDGVTVSWVEFEDGRIFDPHSVRTAFLEKFGDSRSPKKSG